MIEKQIVPDNKKVIDAAINAVQHSRDTRLLSYSDLEEAAKIAESILDIALKKQDRQNVTALVRPRYPSFSAAYRGFPTHTQCYIRRGKKDWYMYDVARTHANREGSYNVVIDLKSLEPKHDAIVNFVTKSLKGDMITKELSCV